MKAFEDEMALDAPAILKSEERSLDAFPLEEDSK